MENASGECAAAANNSTVNAPNDSSASASAVNNINTLNNLPENRFELELEFLQALASPAYLHYLATSRDTEESGIGGGSGTTGSTCSFLQDANFQQFLLYLRDTYSRPEYARFLQYPHSLYFLNVLIEQPNVIKEWTLPAFRNFCHQQQFLAWQYRHSVNYGVGSLPNESSTTQQQGAIPAVDSTLETRGSIDG